MKTDLIDRSYATTRDAAPPRRRWTGRLVTLGAVLAMAAGYVLFYAPQYLPSSLARFAPPSAPPVRAPRTDGPVPVLAAAAARTDVPVYFDGVGSSRALNTVTIRAQVDGKLMSVNFKEGQDVDQDFILAEIEPTIYQAQFDQAVAKKAQDEAQLANARLDLDRYARLAQTNSATHQQYDTQKALVAQLDAQVQVDQGAIDNAKAILSYTKIIAPLAGRTGIRLVDPGNIVHAADTTGIVMIAQLRPIAVIFTLPQQQLAQVNRAFAHGPLSVQALGDDNRTVLDRGTLVVIDNQVDQTTGTVKLKAEFPNADLQLWPGEFVNVKLLVDTMKQVVTVPGAAVQRGPNGTFVYVANDDNTVTVHPVDVALQNDTEAVISSGVDEAERVVTTGFAQLTDGNKIAIGQQENLERPAGSERRRGKPRNGAAVADRQPAPSAQPATTGPAIIPAAAVASPAGVADQPSAQPAVTTGAIRPGPAAVEPAAAQSGRGTDQTVAPPAPPAPSRTSEPSSGGPQRRTQSGRSATAAP